MAHARNDGFVLRDLSTVTASLLVVFALTLLAFAPREAAAAPPPGAKPVVTDSGEALGILEVSTSCQSPADKQVAIGLALVHHMNYAKAEGVFASAAEADPTCALAKWGIALTYVHPLWPDVVPLEKLETGRGLLEDAAAVPGINERERSYISALSAYYAGDERAEADRLAAFLAGWEEAHAKHPDDDEAAAFRALALLGVAPATDKTYARQIEAGEILEGVLARIPKHPGAHHYTIHAYDFPPLAERALDIARRYDDLAPENTHALHMTSHIFTRLGLWPESIEFNERAAAAASSRTAGGAISLHHLHALDYLAYAHLQRADLGAASEVMSAIDSLEPPYQNHSATAYAFAALPARLALERQDWEAAAGIEPRTPTEVPWDKYPHLEAISQFAIALGSARTEKADAAQTAIDALMQLEESAAAIPGAYDWGIQVRIQRIAAEAWLAYGSGDTERGLALAAEAAALESTTEKNPITPGEVLPAQELYGDMLLAAGQAQEALDAYHAALKRSPNRLNSLAGGGRAAEAAGDRDAAREFYSAILEVAPSPSGEYPIIAHARKVVAGG